MCSPWEEAAQPQGERREAAAGAVSISDCPAEEQGGGGSSGLLGGRSASLTLPGDFSALRGQRDASRAGCVPSSPPWRGKQSPALFSPFSAFFFLSDSPMPAPSILPARQQRLGRVVLALGSGTSLSPKPKKQRGGRMTTTPQPALGARQLLSIPCGPSRVWGQFWLGPWSLRREATAPG